MPTQKKKAKHQDAVKLPSTSVPAAAPVQIKSEPLDIKPLGSFVDDRVELIRQAFMCLKPKEITCLAPDAFLGKSIEFIQEQCLDEVLGISTKRLLSIINGTECPTDTDSSDEEKITEHISLDEISSDSEVEVKPLPKKKAAKKAKSMDGKKTGNATAAVNKNGDKKSEKEMTVLELLELQARARAIRSQLAQEPVTKIELDSDEEAAEKAAPASKKPTNSTPMATAAASSSKSSKSSPPKEQQPKRVRLKRNFRVRQVGEEDPPEEESTQKQQAEETQKSPRKSRSKSKEKVDKVVEEKPSEEKKDESAKSRDSSPEVIPVIPSPETLCISSDSEEEKERKRKASIFVANIEELDRQAKEQAKQQEAKKAQEENDDTEEGEISEDERSRKESIGSAIVDKEKQNSPQTDAKLDHEEELDYDEVRELSDSEPDTSGAANQSDKQLEPKVNSADEKSNDSSDSEAESSSGSSEGEPEVVEKQTAKKATTQEDDDDDDDEDDPDIVEIHDSDDETLLDQKLAEDEPEKSWGSRWLESNRVAKVMAASRLGNKVRDKLKKKKKKQKQDEEEAVAAAAAEVARQAEEKLAEAKAAEEQQAVSTAEVGSVEHYNELMSKAAASPSVENAPEEGNKGDEADKTE